MSALRRGWVVIVLAAVVCAGVGAGITVALGPSYATQLQFFVTTTGSASTSDALQGGQFAQQRVASYTELLVGAELAQRVADRVGDSVTADRVASGISATTVTGTVLIDVTVIDADPIVAADVAAAVAAEFPEQIEELETSDESAASVMVSVTDEPSRPTASDTLLRTTAFGLVVGLLLGAVIAVARALLDRTIRDKDQVEELTGAPVTGIVFRDAELAHHGDRRGRVGPRIQEQYRQLATSLQYLDVDRPPKVIMIVSSVPAEGKTTTVVHLAEALAESGARVTVVEADLRRPRVVDQLGLVSGAGLTNILAGKAELADVEQVAPASGFRVLGAGPTPPHPGRLLGSAQMGVLLTQLRADNDYVLVDAAPLLPVADSRALGALVDGVLLTARYGRTTGDQLVEAAAALDSVGARILGVILTMVPPHGELAQALAYGEDYGYEARAGGYEARAGGDDEAGAASIDWDTPLQRAVVEAGGSAVAGELSGAETSSSRPPSAFPSEDASGSLAAPPPRLSRSGTSRAASSPRPATRPQLPTLRRRRH